MENKKNKISTAITYAFSTWWQHIGFFIGMSCLYLICFFSYSLIMTLFITSTNILFIIPTILGLFYLWVTFFLGTIQLSFDIHDHQTSNFRRLFVSFKTLLSAIVSYVIYYILVGIGLLLFIIPGIILAVRLSWANYFIIDQHKNPIEALKMSFHATQGQFWPIFALWLVTSLLVSISPFNLFLLPVASLIYVYAYRHFLGGTGHALTSTVFEKVNT